MAGVAILHPQDVLKQQRQRYVQPMRSRRSTNSSNQLANPNTKNNNNNSNRRKRSPQKNENSRSTSPSSTKSTDLAMGKVKILKRGEALTVPLTGSNETVDLENKKGVAVGVGEDGDLTLLTTDRLGPEPDLVPAQLPIVNFYAGTAFITSPPPSSLPMPGFKKRTDSATIDLRRLLRLDLS